MHRGVLVGALFFFFFSDVYSIEVILIACAPVASLCIPYTLQYSITVFAVLKESYSRQLLVHKLTSVKDRCLTFKGIKISSFIYLLLVITIHNHSLQTSKWKWGPFFSAITYRGNHICLILRRQQPCISGESFSFIFFLSCVHISSSQNLCGKSEVSIFVVHWSIFSHSVYVFSAL